MIKKIKPSKAKLGMFVTEFGQGTFDNPVTKLNKRIETPGELAEIKKQQDGVISIDTARGLDEGKDSPEVSSIVQAAAKGAKSLHFNIGFKSYMQALDCIESVLFAAAGNKPVHLAPARTASRVIADSIIGGNKTECALSIIKTDPPCGLPQR